MDAVLDYYTDLFRQWPLLSDGICWTVISPLRGPVTIDDVVARLTGSPASAVLTPRPFDAAYDHDDRRILHLRRIGDAVAMLEVNGGLAALTPTLERLSAGTRVHTAFWNIKSNSTIAYAQSGRVEVTFEALFPEQRTGSDPGVLDDRLGTLLEALQPPRSDFRPILLSIVEHRTGVRFTPDWCTEDTPAVEVLDA